MKLSDFSSSLLIPGMCTRTMPHPSPLASRRMAAGFTALVVAALVLAACGGGSTKASTSSTSTTTAPAADGGRAGVNRAALQAFTTCLQQHGVSVPTPTTRPPGTPPSTGAGRTGRGFGGFGGGGVFGIMSNPADAAAVQACQSKLPAGFLQQQQQRANQLAAFQSCMKDHGVTVTGSGFGRGPGGTTTTTTPAYAAAFAICKAVLPNGGNFGPSRTTTTTTAA